MRHLTFPLMAVTLLAFDCGGAGDGGGGGSTTATLTTASPTVDALDLSGVNFPGLPPQVIPLSGDLRAPDPSLIRDTRRGDWYVFSTGDPAVSGGTAQIRHSTDLKNWTLVGNVFSQIPAWVVAAVPGVQNIWAPNVFEHDGVYYLYYAASTFGFERVGHRRGNQHHPRPRRSELRLGRPGSGGGLQRQQRLQRDRSERRGRRVGNPLAVARLVLQRDPDVPAAVALGQARAGAGGTPRARGPLRAAERARGVVHSAPRGVVDLFVSFDFCCQGTASTYKIAVGRSRSVTGPYLDRLGTPLEHGGGTVILSENGTMFGPGGESLYGDSIAYHFYDGTVGGDIRLGIRTIQWEGGWPTIATGL